jgi:heat shock protein HslJ
MGQFTSVDGKITGKLAIIDDFVTPYFNNHRAVPMLVTTGSADERYYLTILEGDDMRYATSVPIGDHIKITDVSRKDDEVTVQYLVHDKNQAMEDIPIVGTSAIINIATGVLLQAGRNPATEEVIADKFTGKYYWISTKNADGSVVQPDVADYFAISFGGTNITLSTDCNTGGSTISVGAGSSTTFTVGAIDITKKPCSSRFEGQYFAMFGKVVSYSEPSAGKLILKFADGGSMVFLTEAEKNAPSPAVATSTATGTASSTKK